VASSAEVDKELAPLVAAAVESKGFQMEALKLASVTGDDALMASVLDDGPEGYFTTHKK